MRVEGGMKMYKKARGAVLGALRQNGTREAKVEAIQKRIGNRHVSIAMDGTWTVVIAGDRVGVAKRNTYARTEDQDNAVVGVSVAASRL